MPLFGTTKPEHILENLQNTKIHFSASETSKINEIISTGIIRSNRLPEQAK
jgi:hypothetical protein